MSTFFPVNHIIVLKEALAKGDRERERENFTPVLIASPRLEKRDVIGTHYSLFARVSSHERHF